MFKSLSKYHQKLVAVVLIGFLVGWAASDGVKTQIIRMGDIFIWGPLIIYEALDNGASNPLLGIFLAMLGASTITYNLKNYIHALNMAET